MDKLALKSFKRQGSSILESVWGDGFRASVKIEVFRDKCPCAHCQKERTEKKKIKFNIPMLKTFEEGKYELKEIQKVGNYALRAVWGNGHEEGIYHYEYLRDLFENNALSQEEIDKLL